MKTIFLAWRDPGKRWYPIGRLSHTDGLFFFAYLEGAREAEKVGLRPLVSFPDFEKVFESKTLFPLFANRLPSPSREEFAGFVQWLSLPADERDPLVLLARSAGGRETDTFEVFDCPEKDSDGLYSVHAFVHGLRHRSQEAIERAHSLRSGDKLLVSADPGNAHDCLAIKAHTSDGVHHLGFLPRYLVPDIHTIGVERFDAAVVRVNPAPAPMQFRLLTKLTAPWPAGFSPCSTPEFSPIVAEAAGCGQ